jgi:hypothetical protein
MQKWFQPCSIVLEMRLYEVLHRGVGLKSLNFRVNFTYLDQGKEIRFKGF